MVQQNLFSDRHLLTIYTEIFYFGPLRDARCGSGSTYYCFLKVSFFLSINEFTNYNYYVTKSSKKKSYEIGFQLGKSYLWDLRRRKLLDI